MSVSARGRKWVVRWYEDGRQRQRTFATRREALAFDRDLQSRGPGRPSTGTAILVRVEPDLLAWVDERAGELGQTRAAYIRGVLDAHRQVSR